MLQQPCQSRQDLDCLFCLPCQRAPLLLPCWTGLQLSGGQASADRCWWGYKLQVLCTGPSSQAGPARGFRRTAVPNSSNSRGRGVPLLFCDRSNGGTGCLGNCNVVNQPVQDLSLSRESASCGKIQAHPRPLVNNGPGPFHCPERRSFHFTNGFVSCCSRRISI